MKVGIIFSLFNCEKTVTRCLESWKKIKESSGKDNFVFSCVSARFCGYENFEIPADNTVEIVRAAKIMDSHFTPEHFLPETEVRGLCLAQLKNAGCDLVWMVDGDEEYSVENIEKIISYVEKHKEIAWFSICLKNFVFDEKTYLAKPFCPPRIFRMNFPPFKLGRFFEDNGISWVYNENEISHQIVPNKVIPPGVAWISHYSWSDEKISRQKINYQRSRGWNPTFTYDESGKISFSPAAFRDGKFPEVITEE